jgi:hypothetical protein
MVVTIYRYPFCSSVEETRGGDLVGEEAWYYWDRRRGK